MPGDVYLLPVAADPFGPSLAAALGSGATGEGRVAVVLGTSGEASTLEDRERVLRRLETWLSTQLSARLAPLVALSEASDLSGLARGLAGPPRGAPFAVDRILPFLRLEHGAAGDAIAARRWLR